MIVAALPIGNCIRKTDGIGDDILRPLYNHGTLRLSDDDIQQMVAMDRLDVCQRYGVVHSSFSLRNLSLFARQRFRCIYLSVSVSLTTPTLIP